MKTSLADLQKPLVNVGDTERIIAGAFGIALIIGAVRHRSLLRLVGAAGCFYRAATGNCKGYQLLGVSTCALR